MLAVKDLYRSRKNRLYLRVLDNYALISFHDIHYAILFIIFNSVLFFAAFLGGIIIFLGEVVFLGGVISLRGIIKAS